MSYPTAKKHTGPTWSLLLILAFAGVYASAHQSDIGYRDRGNRYEGVKSFPIADKIELLSAVADYREVSSQFPNFFKLRFYLPEASPVSVTIREVNNRNNYWLDRIRTSDGWRIGFSNDFQWPTGDVIKPLKNIGLDDLGAVVDLKTSSSDPDVHVAPAILFHSQPPKWVDAYLFSFKISRRAEVSWRVSKDEPNSPSLDASSFSVPGRVARTIRWNAAKMKDGKYRLKISIIFSSNGQQVDRIIHFYHHSKVDG